MTQAQTNVLGGPQQGLGSNPVGTPSSDAIAAPPVPVSGLDIASAPREERRSVKKLAQFIWQQYQNGMAYRTHHAQAWIMVKSFLRGIHYFSIDGLGAWRPIPPTPGRTRAVVPILKPMYRHVLGFFNANELDMTVKPVAGSDKPIYKAERSRDILNHWKEETKFADVFDRSNQYLLTEGMVGYHWFRDEFRQNVFVKPLPGSELFPIPFDAKDPSELHGLIHATIVTKQWLELQDDLFERQTGRKPSKLMADKARKVGANVRMSHPLGGPLNFGGKVDGALALTVWFRKNELIPSGEYLFMLGEEAQRHMVGDDEEGEPLTKSIMPDGEIPVEIVYYDKDPSDFWGYGLCESLLPSQLSIDRQMTSAERNTRMNRNLTFVDTRAVDIKDIQDEEASAIPMRPPGMDLADRKRIVEHFPATRVGRDTYALIELARRFSDEAAGFRSGIPFGVQEGRTESGPATDILQQNAFSAINSVLRRQGTALKRLYPNVLVMIRTVWPDDKVVRVTGPGNIGREFRINRDELPWSKEVIIEPAPLLSGGTRTFASILFQLKEVPGPDGKPGSEITSEEFRRALMELKILPPGIDLSDRAEARIRTRVNLLINDGKTPAIKPADLSDPSERMKMEDHTLALKILRDIILDESWNIYSPEVQKALFTEAGFHQALGFNSLEPPNNFDDDDEKLAAIQSENFMSAEEADFGTDVGDFVSSIGA